jgi:hypothetical protein
MVRRSAIVLGFSGLVLIVAGATGAGAAEEEEKVGWYNTASFGLAATDGNSDTRSLNLGYELKRRWERALFTFRANGIQSGNAPAPFAVGDPVNFTIVEPGVDLTTEIYNALAEYSRKITERFFWNAGSSWERNSDAGIENRTSVFGAVGNIWYDTEKTKFATTYGMSWVDQQDEVDDPETDDTYAAVRFASDFSIKFGESTTYDNDFVVFDNVSDLDDFNFRMDNGLAVSMSEALALKVGLTFLYDNIPALREIDLFDLAGTPIGTVIVENDELDTILTVSLVVNFGPK